MSDVVNMDRAGWLNQPNLFDEMEQEAHVDLDELNTIEKSAIRIGIMAATVVLRRRHLITEQGIAILKSEGL